MVTGLDLVQLMIEISSGKPLPLCQKDVKTDGWAIESRVYAEDPERNFLPVTGRLSIYRPPKTKLNEVRVDAGVGVGSDISIYYDPMISKLIVYAENRDLAINKMIKAIDDYDIVGVKTTLPFCKYAIDHKSFRSGDFDTRFVNLYFSDTTVLNPSDEIINPSLVGLYHLNKIDSISDVNLPSKSSNWKLNRT